MRASIRTFVKTAFCGVAFAAASLPAYAQFGNFLQNLPSLPIPGVGSSNSGSKPLTVDSLIDTAQKHTAQLKDEPAPK